MSVFVMVTAQVKPGTEAAFEDAFAEVRERVRGTAGHRGDQLLKCYGEESRYVLLGEWENVERFLEWENSPVHREMTTPMRPYWAGSVERQIFVSTPGLNITGIQPIPSDMKG